MKHYELELEHHYKNKFVSRHKLNSHSGTVVIGQSREADIRLLGEDVSAIHAYIENQKGSWAIIDAGSGQGTWVQKKPILQQDIKEETTVTIGGHQLKLIPRLIEKEVFSDVKLKDAPSKGDKLYHQVVIRKKGLVVSTQMIPATESFAYWFDGKNHVLAPPKKGEVKDTEFGNMTVHQRLVKSTEMNITSQDLATNLRNPDMRTAMLAVIMVAIVMGLLILAIPKKPDTELTELKPENKYTRMIFDAELMKKKRAEAKEARKTIMAHAPAASEQKNTIAPPVNTKGSTKVVSKLKLEGLNALLGKISKRANANGPTVVGYGKTPDDLTAGHAVSTPTVGNVKDTGSSGETYKVGGVATEGKGGGKGRSLAGIGGLTMGAVGAGTVGVLDEETEIDGGLDREVIAKVINGYLGEIRYCYERQLSAEPDIYGKVAVKFTIDADGSVTDNKIGSTTLKSAMVEGCILRRLARWKFPKPKGGTHVLVTYPFMFKATN